MEGTHGPAPPPSATLFEGALLGAEDLADFNESPGYRRLLEAAQRYSESELAARATRTLDIANALEHPELWRGEIVRIRGLVLDVAPQRLARALGTHIDVRRALVIEPDASEGVVVDFLGEAPQLEFERDLVECEAIFYRTVRYESRRGTPRVAPYLIARNLRRLDPEGLARRSSFDTFALVLVGAGGLYLVIRILSSMRKLPRRPRPDAGNHARLIRERAQAALRATPASKS